VNRSLLAPSIALVFLAASATASADLLVPDDSACSGRKASDACATGSGAAGTCTAIVDPKGRAHLECKAGAPLLQPTPTAAATATAAPQPTTTATPQPTSAPAPSPSAAAPPASSCSAGGGAAGSTGALAPLIFAALAALRRRRR
jgi:MYXO-CTERM domain-containing protein